MSHSPAETQPQTTSVQMLDFRRGLGAFVERTYYQFSQFRIMRKDKPMARLVSEPYMQAVEHLVENDPAVAETLELLLDEEFMNALRRSNKDVAEGRVFPIGKLLEE